MTDHQDALGWMRSNIDKHEQPMGSNTGVFVRLCQSQTWLGGTRWPWCVAAWIAAWRLGANRKLPYLGAGAYSMLDWYKTHLPAWVVAASKAKPGAAVIFDIGAGHCAMLAKPYAETDPWIHTIDGNVGDKVSVNKRHITTVRGVVDPPERVISPIPIAKKPVFEVVGSISGKRKVVYVSGGKAVGRKLGELTNKYGGLTIRRRKKPVK